MEGTVYYVHEKATMSSLGTNRFVFLGKSKSEIGIMNLRGNAGNLKAKG